MDAPRICILGAGGLGSVVGGWLAEKAGEVEALQVYLDNFGTWNPEPFV